MMRFASADWPQLEVLNLSHCTNLCSDNLEPLSDASWPCLKELYLQNECRFDAIEAGAKLMSVLAAADWPLLRVLNITDTPLTLEDVDLLCKFTWPFLNSLKFTLESKRVSHGISLVATAWPQLICNRFGLCQTACPGTIQY